MKKLLLSVAAASMMFVACKKEDAAGITKTNEIVNGTIKGKAQVNTDETNFDTTWGWDIYENAPDGTVIIALVNYGGQDFRYQTSVTNGEYSFDIPARNEGVWVEVEYSDFRANLKFGPNAEDVYPDVVWDASDDSFWVYPGNTTINDVMWYN